MVSLTSQHFVIIDSCLCYRPHKSQVIELFVECWDVRTYDQNTKESLGHIYIRESGIRIKDVHGLKVSHPGIESNRTVQKVQKCKG